MEMAGVACAALRWSADKNTVTVRWTSLYEKQTPFMMQAILKALIVYPLLLRHV